MLRNLIQEGVSLTAVKVGMLRNIFHLNLKGAASAGMSVEIGLKQPFYSLSKYRN